MEDNNNREEYLRNIAPSFFNSQLFANDLLEKQRKEEEEKALNKRLQEIKEQTSIHTQSQNIADQLFEQQEKVEEENQRKIQEQLEEIKARTAVHVNSQNFADQLFAQKEQQEKQDNIIDLKEKAREYMVNPQDVVERAMREANEQTQYIDQVSSETFLGEGLNIASNDSSTQRMTSYDVIDRMIAEMERKNDEVNDTSVESQSIRR